MSRSTLLSFRRHVTDRHSRWLSPRKMYQHFRRDLSQASPLLTKNITNDDEKEIRRIIQEIAQQSHQTEDQLTPLDMLRKGHLIKTLTLFLAWTMACTSFYALGWYTSIISKDI